jgi:hypothetical protein
MSWAITASVLISITICILFMSFESIITIMRLVKGKD